MSTYTLPSIGDMGEIQGEETADSAMGEIQGEETAGEPAPSAFSEGPSPLSLKGIKELVDSGLSYVPEKYVRPPAERPCLSSVCHEAELPVIDLADLLGDGRTNVLKAIGDACENWGFFQVINHGIPIGVVEALWAAARQFFGLPAPERMQYFSGLLSKTQISYITSHLPDKEKYREWKDSLYFRCDPRQSEALDQAPAFCREPVLEYLNQASLLARKIYAAILESVGLSYDDRALGVPEMFSGVVMAVHYYPTCPDPSLTFGQSRHSDITLLTLLLQDDVGGLQALNKGKWIAVRPIPGAFVVNVGDPIQILTNGKYKSAEHQIVLSKEKPRFSIPCFFNPPSEAKIAPIVKLVGEGNATLYKECLYGEYAGNALSKGLSGKAPLDFVKV